MVTGQYSKAGRLLQRCLSIRTKALGPDHADVGMTLNNLGSLYRLQHKWSEAEPLFKQALDVSRKQPGGRLREAEVMSNLSKLMQDTRQYAHALAYSDRVLEILEKTPDSQSLFLAKALNNEAALHSIMGHPDQAVPYLERALAVAERAGGADHPAVAHILLNYAAVLKQTKRKNDAKRMEQRARAILEKSSRDNLLGQTVHVSDLTARNAQ
jgi:tetratricopeptide (TPR) repeat protein